MLQYDVKPEIEIFDLAMLYNAANLVEQGLLKPPVHVQFVLGIPNALPADREVLEFEIAQLHRVLPGATWTAAGVGRFQLIVNESIYRCSSIFRKVALIGKPAIAFVPLTETIFRS